MGVVRIKQKNSEGKEIIKWRVRYKDPRTGRQVVNSTWDKRKDADKRWRKVKTQLDEGSYISKQDCATLGEVAKLYAAYTRKQVTPVTMLTYDSVLKKHILPELSHTKLADLTRGAVQYYFDGLADKDLSAKTLQKIRMVLGQVLEYTFDHDMVAQNVIRTKSLKLPKVKRKKPDRLSKKQIRLILEKTFERAAVHGFQPERTIAIVHMAMFAGLRQGEIRALTWSNIQRPEPGERHGWIHVRQAMDKWHNVKEPKSEAGRRSVPLVPGLAKMLKQWKLAQRPNETDFVFTTKFGGPMNPTAVRSAWIVHLYYCDLTRDPQPSRSTHKYSDTDVYGKPMFRFHDLRHVAASLWIAHGCSMKTLQTYVGHESIKTTMDVYGYLLADDEEQSAAVLNSPLTKSALDASGLV